MRRILGEIVHLTRVQPGVEKLFTMPARGEASVFVAAGPQYSASRIQLGLLDAAHILPVGADGSHDGVTNGLALAPTYHRAYPDSVHLIRRSVPFVGRSNPGFDAHSPRAFGGENFFLLAASDLDT